MARILYKITHIESGRAYIGQTTDFKRRMKDHCTANKRISLINRAIKKYGKEQFKFEKLMICEDFMIDEMEQKAIASFDTLVPNGFNLETGGNACKKLSQETRQKIREKAIGRPSPTLGRKMPEEQRQKLIADNKGKILTEEHKNKISSGLKKKFENLNQEERIKRFGHNRKEVDLSDIADYSYINGISKRTNKKFKNNKSGYIGVHLQSKRNKYIANIRFGGKCLYIGSFETAQEAAIAYNNKAIELFGDNANLNIIREEK